MQPLDFVTGCKQARDELLALHLHPEITTLVGRYLAEAKLNAEQRRAVEAALAAAVTDSFYTLLLGLDGATSLGDTQQNYRILDEDGQLISVGNGELEGEAYCQFHQHVRK